MTDNIPKDFMDTAQLLKDPCCPFSKRALYWHIWRRGINGLEKHIYCVGRKIIISRTGFIAWLTSNQRKARGTENE